MVYNLYVYTWRSPLFEPASKPVCARERWSSLLQSHCWNWSSLLGSHHALEDTVPSCFEATVRSKLYL